MGLPLAAAFLLAAGCVLLLGCHRSFRRSFRRRWAMARAIPVEDAPSPTDEDLKDHVAVQLSTEAGACAPGITVEAGAMAAGRRASVRACAAAARVEARRATGLVSSGRPLERQGLVSIHSSPYLTDDN